MKLTILLIFSVIVPLVAGYETREEREDDIDDFPENDDFRNVDDFREREDFPEEDEFRGENDFRDEDNFREKNDERFQDNNILDEFANEEDETKEEMIRQLEDSDMYTNEQIDVFKEMSQDSKYVYDEMEDNIDNDDIQYDQEDEGFQQNREFQENDRFQKDGGFLEDEGLLEEEGLLDEDRFLNDEQFREDQRSIKAQERELENFRDEMEIKAIKRETNKDSDEQEQQDCDEQLPTKEDIIQQLKDSKKYSNEQMEVFKELSQDELITDITDGEEKDENVMNDPKPKPWWFWGRRRGIKFPKSHCKY